MTTIDFTYYVSFGKGDGSDSFEWSYSPEGEEEKKNLDAVKLRIPVDESPVCQAILKMVTQEIEDYELDILRENEDEYCMELAGKIPVDPDEINELVREGDEHALEYFHLTDLSAEEREQWDAHSLKELPNICDYDEDFEPESPFDAGWSLSVHFSQPPEEMDLSEDEAKETLTELFKEANGDYSKVREYINNADFLFEGDDLTTLANTIAGELGLTDYAAE